MKKLFICFFGCFILCSLFITSTGYSGESIKYSEKLLQEIRHSNKAGIAKLFYATAKKGPAVNRLSTLFKLLDNKETILKDDPDYSAANIQIRDIALVCLLEMTGEDFTGDVRGKEIITYFSENGTPYRFTIPSLSDDEYKRVKHHVELWIDGFKQGVETKRSTRKSIL